MKKALLVSITLVVMYVVGTFAAGTTVNGTRVINGDLTVKGTCTGCGGGGSLVLVQQHTVSGATDANFPNTDSPPCISSTYDDYQIDLVGLTMNTNTAVLLLQVSTDGTTYVTSGYLSMVAGWTLDAAAPGTGTSTSGITLINT